MEQQLLKQVRMLRLWLGGLTVVLVAVLVLAFRPAGDPQFEEISVERINVVEKDGKLRMVISNKEKQHPGRMGGKESAPREREPGMIFFNEDGDECGGFIFDGTKASAGMVVSFDQYRNDKVMQLQYMEDSSQGKRSRAYGLRFWGRDDTKNFPAAVHRLDSLKLAGNQAGYDAEVRRLAESGDFGQERMFVGKGWNDETGLFIRDEKGRPRIKLYVDKQGKGHLEWLDENGKLLKN